ncbi:uncharacterized protein BKA78DRAFT_293512 [Phyllosticta capitalensis]|uniref:uncharacterized protein n=1 Tax=Phyllosticta capitalensis TaxID=121624 RepID=UPI00312DABD9
MAFFKVAPAHQHRTPVSLPYLRNSLSLSLSLSAALHHRRRPAHTPVSRSLYLTHRRLVFDKISLTFVELIRTQRVPPSTTSLALAPSLPSACNHNGQRNIPNFCATCCRYSLLDSEKDDWTMDFRQTSRYSRLEDRKPESIAIITVVCNFFETFQLDYLHTFLPGSEESTRETQAFPIAQAFPMAWTGSPLETTQILSPSPRIVLRAWERNSAAAKKKKDAWTAEDKAWDAWVRKTHRFQIEQPAARLKDAGATKEAVKKWKKDTRDPRKAWLNMAPNQRPRIPALPAFPVPITPIQPNYNFPGPTRPVFRRQKTTIEDQEGLAPTLPYAQMPKSRAAKALECSPYIRMLTWSK